MHVIWMKKSIQTPWNSSHFILWQSGVKMDLIAIVNNLHKTLNVNVEEHFNKNNKY